LNKAEFVETDIFKLQIPKGVTGVPAEILDPAKSWKDKEEYKASLNSLASLFVKNFNNYKNEKTERLLAGGPAI
jgi:phosphoenolpyruvate carboxykinase (ATP)